MVLIKTFKGYEDKTIELEESVNEWIIKNRVDVLDIRVNLSHEPDSRSRSGDLVCTVLYRADQVIK